MDRLISLLAAVFGFTGVAFGAFGAHAIKSMVDQERLPWWETASRYHLVHALALVFAAILAAKVPGRLAKSAGWCFAAGIVLFSGSLYLMTATGVRGLGAVTPFGGLLLLAGWALTFAAALKLKPAA